MVDLNEVLMCLNPRDRLRLESRLTRLKHRQDGETDAKKQASLEREAETLVCVLARLDSCMRYWDCGF